MKYLQVTVIAQAQCRYFASNLQYIESFHWASEANDRGNLRCVIVDIIRDFTSFRRREQQVLEDRVGIGLQPCFFCSNMKENNNRFQSQMDQTGVELDMY